MITNEPSISSNRERKACAHEEWLGTVQDLSHAQYSRMCSQRT